MSLDVYLKDADGETIYSANITHNLGEMSKVAGIYKCVWRPDENGITRASQIIEPLSNGLALLALYKGQFVAYNPENGWGNYDNLLTFCVDYLQACRDNPDAAVAACR